jgi:hypothetical protein
MFGPGNTTTASVDAFSILENQLRYSLKPVNPNPEFVSHLRQHLSSPRSTTLEKHNGTLDLAIFLLGFVLGTSLLVLLVARLVMALIRLISSMGKTNSQG